MSLWGLFLFKLLYTGIDTDTGIDSGTDSDSYNRQGPQKTGAGSREFKSELILRQLPPRGMLPFPP